MGLINAFIDALDKKWGEQAMQKKINVRDELLEEKDGLIEEKDGLLKERDGLLKEKDKIIEELRKENQNLRQAQKPEDGEDDEDGTGNPDLEAGRINN